MQTRVVRVKTAEQLTHVRQLRYQVFIEELHYKIPDATPEDGLADAADDTAILFLAYDGDTPAGTLAVDSGRHAKIGADEMAHFRLTHFTAKFPIESMLIMRKGLVTAKWRGTNLFMTMAQTAYAELYHPQIAFAFVDCSPYLVRYYESFGFRRYAPHFSYDETAIPSVPLCLVVNDHVYLERIGSPLRPMLTALGHKDDPGSRSYFERYWTLPGSTQRDVSEVLKTAPMLSQEIVTSDVKKTDLFCGIEKPDIHDFLDLCAQSPFCRRDPLVLERDRDTDLFVLETGYVEIIRRREGAELCIATLGPGTIFGEASLLLGTVRSASVVALTDGLVWRVPRQAIEGLIADRPRLAALLYRNLARILANRVKTANLWITEAPPLR